MKILCSSVVIINSGRQVEFTECKSSHTGNERMKRQRKCQERVPIRLPSAAFWKPLYCYTSYTMRIDYFSAAEVCWQSLWWHRPHLSRTVCGRCAGA